MQVENIKLYGGVRFGHCFLFQSVLGDAAADGNHIGSAGKFKADAAQRREEQIELRIQIEDTGGLHGKGNDVAVGHGGVILLFAGKALDVDRNDALVGKDHIIADGGIAGNDFLAGDEQGGDVLFPAGGVPFQFVQNTVFEVDHEKTFFLFNLYFPRTGPAGGWPRPDLCWT